MIEIKKKKKKKREKVKREQSASIVTLGGDASERREITPAIFNKNRIYSTS